MEQNVKDRPRCLIYARVSTASQEEEGLSLPAQEETCRTKAAELGYEVAQVYREAYTGTEGIERPQLKAMRQQIKHGGISAVIVKRVDRLTRKQGLTGVLMYEWDQLGCEIISVLDPINPTKEGRLLLSIGEYVAEAELDRIRERTVSGKRQRLMQGKLHRGGCELYGFRRDHERGVREIYEPEALWVRRIFDWYTRDEMSIRSIANQLNLIGVPSPSVGKQAGKRKDRPAQWCPAAIHLMLKNPCYRGETIVWKTQAGQEKGANGLAKRVPRPESEQIRLEGVTPAIVSDEVWEAAQVRLQSNKGHSTRNAKNPFLLRGLIFCAVCNRPMRCTVSKGRRMYRCSSLEDLSGPCGSKYVPADNVAQRVKGEHGRWAPRTKDTPTIQGIDQWAFTQVLDFLNNPDLADELLEREAAGAGATQAMADELETARGARAKLQRETERLVALYASADDEMPLELIGMQLKSNQSKIANLDDTIREKERRLAAQQRAVDEVNSLHEYLISVGTILNLDPNKDYGDRPRGIVFDFPTMRRIVEDLGVKVFADGRSWRLDCDILVPTEEDHDLIPQAEAPSQSKRRTRPPAFPGGREDHGSTVQAR